MYAIEYNGKINKNLTHHERLTLLLRPTLLAYKCGSNKYLHSTAGVGRCTLVSAGFLYLHLVLKSLFWGGRTWLRLEPFNKRTPSLKSIGRRRRFRVQVV